MHQITVAKHHGQSRYLAKRPLGPGSIGLVSVGPHDGGPCVDGTPYRVSPARSGEELPS